jgi:hypothetical protein
MTTGTKIIQRALSYIGAHSPLSPANPESILDGMDILNSFIAELQDNDVDMGCVPLAAPGEELSEPLGARNAIEENLAVLLIPLFPGAKVSPFLQANATKSLQKLRNQWETVSIPKRQVRGTLPKGQGNKYFFHNTYFDEGDELA